MTILIKETKSIIEHWSTATPARGMLPMCKCLLVLVTFPILCKNRWNYGLCVCVCVCCLLKWNSS